MVLNFTIHCNMLYLWRLFGYLFLSISPICTLWWNIWYWTFKSTEIYFIYGVYLAKKAGANFYCVHLGYIFDSSLMAVSALRRTI